MLSKLSVTLLALALTPLTSAARSHRKRWNPGTSITNVPLDNGPRVTGDDVALDYYRDGLFSSILRLQDVEHDHLGASQGEYEFDTEVYAEPPESHLEQAIERRENHNDGPVHTVNLNYHKAIRFAGDNIWTAVVKIGRASFNLQLDLQSSDIWVLAGRFRSTNKKRYQVAGDSAEKNLEREIFEPKRDGYGLIHDKTATARKDRVTVGGIKVKYYTFGTVMEPSKYFLNLPFDGLFGLGFPALSAPGFTPFLNAAYDQQRRRGTRASLKSRIFAFYLAEEGSQLRIGGIGSSDVFVSGSIDNHKLIPLEGATFPSDWMIGDGEVKMTYKDGHDHWNIKETNIASNVRAMIDSRTNMILAPKEDVEKIYANILGTSIVADYYAFPCGLPESVFPAIRFAWRGGKEWTLTRQSFTIYEAGRVCLGAIQVKPASKGHPDIWVLGSSFLMNVFSVFNMEDMTVGFGILKDMGTYRQWPLISDLNLNELKKWGFHTWRQPIGHQDRGPSGSKRKPEGGPDLVPVHDTKRRR